MHIINSLVAFMFSGSALSQFTWHAIFIFDALAALIIILSMCSPDDDTNIAKIFADATDLFNEHNFVHEKILGVLIVGIEIMLCIVLVLF